MKRKMTTDQDVEDDDGSGLGGRIRTRRTTTDQDMNLTTKEDSLFLFF